ncbi:DNA-binding transcriptional regulator OxyR [Martelella alba]|uniref:DNA-binding transcriptional regulator OxyR n=1 Tax=Martelella alba TaxID=2590451 RepID=A0ABY2SHS4_9HYPH|nr:DNA-binding transcriptional regulator OxyR [Martelella alba]TKI04576.1 DNA-binding transcriptional regulator OxyR [Martelella alba]
MNIRDLEYLVALAEKRHFQRAADACNVSQPTLSAQIRKLEDELGLRLLERTTRKVHFTQNGLQLVEQTKAVLRELKALRSLATLQKDVMQGPTNIGIIPTIAPYLIPLISPVICQKFPNLDLYLHEEQTHQLLAMLEAGKIECAIMAMVRETSQFAELPLYEEPFLLAVTRDHPLAQETAVDMHKLAGNKLIMLNQGNCLRWQAMRYCYQFDAEEDTRFAATNLETLRTMIACNGGMTFMPKLAVRRDDRCVYLPCVNPEPKRTIVMVFRHGNSMRSRYEQLRKEIARHMKPILEQNIVHAPAMPAVKNWSDCNEPD